jgi:hypothetical protein
MGVRPARIVILGLRDRDPPAVWVRPSPWYKSQPISSIESTSTCSVIGEGPQAMISSDERSVSRDRGDCVTNRSIAGTSSPCVTSFRSIASSVASTSNSRSITLV